MSSIRSVIIGGGPAGIAAAISAKRKGHDVALLEKMAQVGKKLLISGSGRCNLSHERLDAACYNAGSRALVAEVFEKFGGRDILDFFKGLGLKVYSEGGRIFPITDQASSVLKVLEIELDRLKVPIVLKFDCVDISPAKGGFMIKSRTNEIVECDRIVLAGGGKTYPALGSDGGSYALAKLFGHSIIEPVPSAVPLVVKDRMCHLLQGQRIRARAKAVVDSRVACEAGGELLFTKYGLSGTAILDISSSISIAINRGKARDAWVECDLVPFMGEGELAARIARGIGLAGILPNRFEAPFAKAGAAELKKRRFKVLATRGWNEAEFTAGGIDVRDVNEATLESRLRKGLYFAGEILDVDGRRGGYNLAWAWASGVVAGRQT